MLLGTRAGTVAASLVVLVSGTFSPTTDAGSVWIALQALVVGRFAAPQGRR